MSTPEGALPSADVSSSPATTSGSSPADSSSASVATGAPQSDAGSVTAPVQGQDSQQTPDIFADLPSVEELTQQGAQGVKYAAALANLRGVVEPIRTEFGEFKAKYEPYASVLERFEQPDQLQETLNLHDKIVGWERDAQTNELVPATSTGAQMLSEKYPQHADFLAADLLNMSTRDPSNGQMVPRIDLALKGIAADPTERAKALRILGAVEPSSISPQWQATEDELAIVRDDLKDTYKKLSYEERQELKLANPDFINKFLERERYTQNLETEKAETASREAQQQQQREAYISHQATQAGEQYTHSLLTDALTTFHNSVVEKCNFLQPIDPQNPPQGMSAQDVQTMNAQIDQSNKAEAAQITGLVIALQNEQTRPFVVPLLQQIGVLDDKFLKAMDEAASGVGLNARNFGELNYRGRLQANGNGFQPDASMANLNNAAKQNLNRLVHYANQLAGKLMEQRSQFFSMKATDHNATLNTGIPRPNATGTAYNPSTAAAPAQSTRWPTRQELEAQYG